MRHVLVLSTACAASLLLLSCNASQPTSPAASAMDETNAMTPVASLATRIDGADLLAGFHISIDPDTLVATATPHRAGSAQPPQGQIYDLDIANFQNADSFRVTGVQVLGSGNFRISYSHAHPFPAPNLANPASGSNRADLGYTGRLLILTTYNPRSYFSDSVRMSAGAVVSPDGYVETGDLLANTEPGLVTAYPYKLLADEAQDNRTGVSNGGAPEGSYLDGGGGWQRINLGASGTGWTGFDYVHGGQTVTNQFTLSKDSLAASNFALDVALLIQYQDPRGAGGSTFRFPPTVIDPLQFAYRLPYAALDCSRVTPTATVIIAPTVGASTTLEVRVRDWDATATEAADSKVGDEADVTLVQQGGSGAPEVALDAPGILTGLRNMGTPGTETGWSDDLLLYSNSLPNQEGAPAGTYYACLRVTDPEYTDTARNTYHAGVDATTLLPDAARAVPARTWQIVPITIGPDVPTVSSVSPIGIIGGIDERITFSAVASNSPTSWSWDFGGGTVPAVSTAASPTVQLGRAIGTYQGTVIATNAGGDSQAFAFEYRVLEPQAPGWQFHELDQINGPYSFFGTAHNLFLYNGKPVIAMTPDEDGGPLRVALSSKANPTQPSDWSSYDVVANDAGSPCLFEANGRLAMTYLLANGGDRALGYARATVNSPGSASDWVSFMAFNDAGLEGAQSIALEYHNRVVVAFDGSMGALVLITSDTTPDQPSDFGLDHLPTANARGCALAIASGDTDDRLLLAFSVQPGATILLLQSEPEFPDDAGDWKYVWSEAYDLFAPDGLALMPYPVDATHTGVVMAWRDTDTNQPRLLFTSGYSNMGAQTPNYIYSLPGISTGNDVHLGMLNDRLMLTVPTLNSRPIMYRALTELPSSDAEWVARALPNLAGGNYNQACIASDNAFIMLMDHVGTVGNHYTIGTSTGPW